MDQYSKHYSEESFWRKVKQFAVRAGKQLIHKALTLYYTAQDSDTPAWAKGVIVAALGYFIFPADTIPDVIPFAGLSDDLGAITVALAMIATHVKKEHTHQANETVKQWFAPKTENS